MNSKAEPRVPAAPTGTGAPEIYPDILATLGDTPLVRLNRVTAGCRATVLAKVEYFNPGGSVKDRIAVAIIEEGERKGLLKPGGTIVEATSGNTGTGLAMVGAVKGYRVVLTMPDKVSREKINLVKAFGAEVFVTPTAVPPDSPESYYEVARRVARERPGSYLVNQYHNPSNIEAHYRTTGPEIWRQTGGKLDYFVAGMGTGGTISGTSRYLKEMNPKIRTWGADPVGSILKDYFYTKQMVSAKTYKVEGIGEDFVPGATDFTTIDDVMQVTDFQSLNTTRRLAREEGILAGGSAGTAVYVALQVAKQAKEGEVVVVILPDTGERYLTKVHSDEWMRDNRLLDTNSVTVAQVLKDKANGVPALVTVAYDETVERALALIREFNISQLPVLKEGGLVGCVTEGILLQKVLDGSAKPDARIEYVIEKALPTVPADAHLPRAIQLLAASNAAVAVDAHGKPVGIVTRMDLLGYVAG